MVQQLPPLNVTEKNTEELYLDILAFVKKHQELEEELNVLENEKAELKNGLLLAIDRAKIKKLKKKFIK